MITNADLDWLEIHYPGVIYVPAKNVLQGCLWFRMVYFPAGDISIVDPDETVNLTGGVFIEDAYELVIGFNKDLSVTVREVAGRILHTKRKWKLSLADVHIYSDGSLCLCPEPEEKLRLPNGFNLRDFFQLSFDSIFILSKLS